MRAIARISDNSMRAYAAAMNESGPAVSHPFAIHHQALQTPDGGFSINPLTKAKPTKQFMVALDAAHGGLEASHPIHQLTPDHIAAHAMATQKLYGDPNTFQGGWHDPNSGTAYLDASRQFGDRNSAMDFARQNKQISIFDLHAGQSVPTEYLPGDQQHAHLST